MISVIIPAYNEEENIKTVINICKNNDNVDEIIVVNNLSTDKTEEIAKSEGDRVVFCGQKGKGYAMEKGIKEAKLDNNIFYPREEKIKQSEMTSITIIGSEEFKFKNIEAILQVIRKLKERYPIQLNWVTQTKPERNKEEAIINPEQKRIGDILRNTDIYICNSEYESFGLPTLEAMTCGATVITTDTGGMRDFVQDGKNALVIQKNDNKDMEEKIELLIKDNKLRQKLAEEGIKTAQRFQWENSIEKIEEYYRKIANYQIFNDKDEKEDNNDER